VSAKIQAAGSVYTLPSHVKHTQETGKIIYSGFLKLYGVINASELNNNRN
jgi:hypothetical protein